MKLIFVIAFTFIFNNYLAASLSIDRAKIDSTSLFQRQEAISRDTSVYRQAYQAAIKDNHLSNDEKKILHALQKALELDDARVNLIEQKLQLKYGDGEQSGRWQFVLQNTGWGAGLYGWGLPYLLGKDEARWMVGMEMLTLGSTFYLSQKYSEKMDIPLARSQMLGLGSSIGLYYGFAINELFELNNEDYYYNGEEDEKRAWMATLMSTVPIGMLAGQSLYNRWQPDYGRTWALSLGTLVALKSAYDMHVALDPEPEEPMLIDPYQSEKNPYKKWIDEHTRWEKRRALITMTAYPLAVLGSKILTENKNYTFGDAIMSFQGYLSGVVYNYMILDMLNIDNQSLYRLGNIGLGFSGIYLYQKMIDGYDYTFGESFLMGLGTASGMAFGLGTAIITEASSQLTSLFVLCGGISGTLLTKLMISPQKESPILYNQEARLSISPALYFENYREKKSAVKILPGLNFSYQLP